MGCPGYLPHFVKQLDGSAYAGSNCTCASAAMAADDDSCGSKTVTPSVVRLWTGDTSGGTNLSEVDDALRTHLAIDLDTQYRYPWSSFMKRLQGGAGAILQGWYAPIRDSRFSGSETFGGNHAIFVNPGLIAMDPLADGRRPGIYKYHGEAYPEALLRSFAGKLNIGAGRYVPLGDGLVYASFTRNNGTTGARAVIDKRTELYAYATGGKFLAYGGVSSGTFPTIRVPGDMYRISIGGKTLYIAGTNPHSNTTAQPVPQLGVTWHLIGA